jgi:hypothetical protein
VPQEATEPEGRLARGGKGGLGQEQTEGLGRVWAADGREGKSVCRQAAAAEGAGVCTARPGSPGERLRTLQATLPATDDLRVIVAGVVAAWVAWGPGNGRGRRVGSGTSARKGTQVTSCRAARTAPQDGPVQVRTVVRAGRSP